MKIIDLDEKHQSLYCLCLEDWSDEIKEAGDHKRVWYSRMKDKGIRVKLAVDDNDQVGGMIQYAPIEHAFAEGKDLYFIYCIWVHGYKKGRGNFQKRGMGKALLQAAESDAKTLGAKGIAAWGVRLPFWMRASWFKKQGYIIADKDGMRMLLWKPFTNDIHPPKWIHKKKSPTANLNQVTVTAFLNGWCPAMNLVFERAKRAASQPEFQDKVVFQEIDTFDRNVLLDWGISDALFIDDKEVRTGPPPTFKKLKKLIQRRANKVKK